MIDWGKALTAIGVGVGDELVADWDESTTPPRTEPFKTAQDIARLIAAIGGWGLAAFSPKYTRIGETLGIAATPLLVKTAWAAVAAQQGEGGRVALPNRRGGRKVPTGAGGAGKQAGRYPSPPFQPEFQKARLD